MALEFVVIRIQNKQDGTTNVSRFPFDNEVAAWKEFYRSCGSAVDSDCLTDAVAILTKEGFELDHKCWVHPATTPNPQPEATQGE